MKLVYDSVQLRALILSALVKPYGYNISVELVT